MEEAGLPGRIEVVAYDPAWPAAYAAEAAALRPLCGPALIELEHIGSTAVPGLAAKPVIDMMAAVPDLGAARALTPQLRTRGYRRIDAGMSDRLFLHRRPEGGRPAFHLHLVERAAWPRRHERIMRDHLLAHPEAAAAYAALKAGLAEQFAEDREAYTRAKTAFIQALVGEACATQGLTPIDVWND